MRKRTYNKFKCVVIGVVLVMASVSVWAKMDTKDEKQIAVKREVYLEVPQICQYPILPTGCESVAAAMVLQYYGEDIKAETFATLWLTCDNSFYYEEDVLYGPDPLKVFAGDPFSQNSYGCFAPVIEKAVNDHSSQCHAKVLNGESLMDLCDTYLNRGNPLLIWATMGMKESKTGNSWVLEDGTNYTWIAGEHCLVLVGYDDRHYYLNDPISGGTVGYDKTIVEMRYKELGMQAVYISLKQKEE